MKKIINVIKSPFILNLIANCIAQLVTFGGMIIYPHLLSHNDFGLYSFCYNIINLFLLFNGFGATSGILQFVSKNYNNKILQLKYLKKAFYLGIIFNIFISIIILLYSQYGYFAITGANKILLLMAFFPIGRLYIDILQVYYRASQQNNLFAKFTITTNITLLIINIISTYKYGLNGLIIGTYITYILVFIISFKLLNILEIVQLNNNDINTKEFIKFSSYNVFATAFSQIIFILDIILLGYIIHDTKLIAIYKIATTIPFALNFIPGVIVSYYYPIITKIKQEQKSVKNFMHKLQIKMFGLTLLISTILIITAKPLIILIWGTKYISAITPFRILMIGYPLIACGRIIYGMILAIYGKVSFSMWLNIILLFINLLSTYFLITHYNIIGAALGILFIYFISSLISAYVVYNIIK